MHHHCVWNGSCSIHIQIHGVQLSASCYAAQMHQNLQDVDHTLCPS